MQLIRQPLIIGHIITGLIVGPYFLNIVQSTQTIDLFSQLGIALLLFIVGLSLSPRVIKEVGLTSLITGLGQVIFTTAIGFAIAQGLGFAFTPSLYISLALAFSSTIIVLKLLSDKKDLHRLYGKIATGFLLVQDLVAITILIIISSVNNSEEIGTLLFEAFLKGAVLTAIITYVAFFILPRLSAYFAKNQEFLFLFSISWGLGLALLFAAFGFSLEIGALVAGVTLSSSDYSREIGARLKPLRDFFLVLFFILLGSHLSIGSLLELLNPALLLSLFVLIGNPLVVLILMGILGFNKKTSFKAGLTVAQISEFSLILITLGNRLGHVDQEIISLVTLVALITIAGSTYMILYSDQLYKLLAPALTIFERKNVHEQSAKNDKHDILLFGYNSIGHHFIQSFQKLQKDYAVIDYDPATIEELKQLQIPHIYGDAYDNELLDTVGVDKAKLIVSTIGDYDTNQLIVSHTRMSNKKAIIIAKSDTVDEANRLYSLGASYVMMPHYISAHHTGNLISKYGLNIEEFAREKNNHINYLEKHATKR